MSKATVHVKSVEKKNKNPPVTVLVDNDVFFKLIITLALTLVIAAFGLLTYKNPVYLALMIFGLSLLMISKFAKNKGNYGFWFFVFTVLYAVIDFYLTQISGQNITWRKLIPFSSYINTTMPYFLNYIGITKTDQPDIINIVGFAYMWHNLAVFFEYTIILSICKFFMRFIKEI